MGNRRKAPKRKKPAVGTLPKGKNARYKAPVSSSDNEVISWRLAILDTSSDWGWHHLNSTDWWNDILPFLKNIETMTWAEIFAGSGGKSRNHTIAIHLIVADAQKLLADKNLDDNDNVISLRYGTKGRVWGIRYRSVCKLIWYDPRHEIYPTLPN